MLTTISFKTFVQGRKNDIADRYEADAIWPVGQWILWFDEYWQKMHENAHKVDVSKWKESGATIYGRLAIFRIFRSKADGNSWTGRTANFGDLGEAGLVRDHIGGRFTNVLCEHVRNEILNIQIRGRCAGVLNKLQKFIMTDDRYLIMSFTKFERSKLTFNNQYLCFQYLGRVECVHHNHYFLLDIA